MEASSENSRLVLPPGVRAEVEKTKPLPVMVSTNTSHNPDAEQLQRWEERAQRLAPFGMARQLVFAVEVEIWVDGEKALSQRVTDALTTYLERGQEVENNGEIMLRDGTQIRHRFINRYFDKGRLDQVMPSAGPVEGVAANDPRLQA